MNLRTRLIRTNRKKNLNYFRGRILHTQYITSILICFFFLTYVIVTSIHLLYFHVYMYLSYLRMSYYMHIFLHLHTSNSIYIIKHSLTNESSHYWGNLDNLNVQHISSWNFFPFHNRRIFLSWQNGRVFCWLKAVSKSVVC